jgi:hypothetical protein
MMATKTLLSHYSEQTAHCCMRSVWSVQARYSQRAVSGNYKPSAPFFHLNRVFAWAPDPVSYKAQWQENCYFYKQALDGSSKKYVARRRNSVINSNEVHCFTKEEGFEYVDIGNRAPRTFNVSFYRIKRLLQAVYGHQLWAFLLLPVALCSRRMNDYCHDEFTPRGVLTRGRGRNGSDRKCWKGDNS